MGYAGVAMTTSTTGSESNPPAAPAVVRERLDRGGWTLASLVEPLMVLEGRQVAGFHGTAWRDDCFGSFALALQCEDRDQAFVDRFYRETHVSVVPAGRSTLYANALDGARAREEIEALREVLGHASFEGIVAAVEARGWVVDPARTFEDRWDVQLHVRASRAGEDLDIGVGWTSALDTPEVRLGRGGWVSARLSPGVGVSACVRSSARAGELLRALLAGA